MSETSSKKLTREQLAEKFQWNQFPPEIQDLLYAHYQEFQHEGNGHLAEMDIQSATDAVRCTLLGSQIGSIIGEHEGYFGLASTVDLSSISQRCKRYLAGFVLGTGERETENVRTFLYYL